MQLWRLWIIVEMWTRCGRGGAGGCRENAPRPAAPVKSSLLGTCSSHRTRSTRSAVTRPFRRWSGQGKLGASSS